MTFASHPAGHPSTRPLGPDDVDPVVLRGPQQLIAALPYRLGFRPEHSLVIAALTASRPGSTRRGVGICARIDLPLPDEVASVAATLTRMWTTPDGFGRGGEEFPAVILIGVDVSPPGSAALEVAEQLLVEAGVEVFDVVLTWTDPDGTRRWSARGCDDRHGSSQGSRCPVQGHPLGEDDETPVAAEFVGRGVVARERRADVVPDLTPVPLTARARARGAATDLRERLRSGRAGRAEEVEQLVALITEQAARCARPDVPFVLPDPETCGRLLVAAEVDAVLPVLTDLLHGPGQPAPDVVEGCLQLLHGLARHADAPLAARLLAQSAYVAWFGGRGVLAGACVVAALERDPGEPIAMLVSDLLDRCVPPAWVVENPAAGCSTVGPVREPGA